MLHIFKWALDFAKDMLIDKAVSSIIPLQVPHIKTFVKIPLVGKVHTLLPNTSIYHVDIASSYVKTRERHYLSCFWCHCKFEHNLIVFLKHLVGLNCNYR